MVLASLQCNLDTTCCGIQICSLTAQVRQPLPPMKVVVVSGRKEVDMMEDQG